MIALALHANSIQYQVSSYIENYKLLCRRYRIEFGYLLLVCFTFCLQNAKIRMWIRQV